MMEERAELKPALTGNILYSVPGDAFRGRKKLYHVLKDVERLCNTLHPVIQ